MGGGGGEKRGWAGGANARRVSGSYHPHSPSRGEIRVIRGACVHCVQGRARAFDDDNLEGSLAPYSACVERVRPIVCAFIGLLVIGPLSGHHLPSQAYDGVNENGVTIRRFTLIEPREGSPSESEESGKAPCG